MITFTKRLPVQSDRTVAQVLSSAQHNNDLDWTMSALVTFKCFLGVGGQLHSQAEPDSRRAASDQHHLCIHVPH